MLAHPDATTATAAAAAAAARRRRCRSFLAASQGSKLTAVVFSFSRQQE